MDHQVASPITNPSITSLGHNSYKIKPVLYGDHADIDGIPGYWETQIHKGVKLSDISKVVIRDVRCYDQTIYDLRDSIEAEGIPVELVDV